MDAFLDAEWTAARRERKPLSLVLADIDCFKEYNDCYGHLAGDACLRRVASLLEATAERGRGLLGRFGGEEFLMVLPDTDAAAARERAERCLARLAEAQIPHEGSRVGKALSVSLGVATLVPGEGDDLLAFLEAVDRCLYQAKAQGRNRIVVHEDTPASHA